MPVQKIVSKSEKSLKPTQPVVNVFDEKIQFAIQDLLDTMAAEQARLDVLYPGQGKGIGLASNQIDYPAERYGADFQIPSIYVLSIRAPRLEVPVPPSVFINAEITPLSGKIEQPEGCLSVMGFTGWNVSRYETIKINALNEKGEPVEATVSGLIAQAHQHEGDHLIGDEYLSRMSFSVGELRAILDWLVSVQKSGVAAVSPWLVEAKLQCTAEPDLSAMTVWADHALQKACLAESAEAVSHAFSSK
ncbi:MAG: peptide deformylase [Gammaproteobacteria bacterium]|nr:peptide deformylase [Gammaproteobacteria bacterium]